MNALAKAVTLRLEQLKKAQWISPDDIKTFQFQQLKVLTEYCEHHSPYFAQRLKAADLTCHDFTPSGFTRLPQMTRRHLQDAGNTFYCKKSPENHGAVYKTKTSGSTGEPVTVKKTGLNQLNWFATNLLDHLWHSRDFNERLCAIRPTIQAHTPQDNWGLPANLLFKTGNSLGLPITAAISQLAEWISEFQPNNLLIYPSTLKALTDYCLKNSCTFIRLDHIRTLGETLSVETRQQASTAFKAKVEDTYSSQEIGTIALECPISGLYHIMEENLIVEVLKQDGRPCAPSEIGRVVITDLHNYSTPLIRYDIGDYAEVGERCPCGRGLSTLKNVRGRERNLIMKPDGSRHWPLTNFMYFRDIAPIRQYQMTQENLKNIEVRFVAERAVTADEEQKLKVIIQQGLGHPFDITFTYFDNQIPLSTTGKFEEFICRVK